MSARMLVSKDSTFRVFESVSYVGRPWFIGLPKATILYENMLWRNNEPLTNPPIQASIDYWVNLLTSNNIAGPLILDIEHWPIYTDPVTRQYLVDIVNAFKHPERKYQVGYYGFIPQRDTFASLLPHHPSYQAWKDRNTTVQPIADAVDVLYPSLYTLYSDEHRWIRYATENILEARRLANGKKIIPILWPQYHTNCDRKALEYIDSDFWYTQLLTVYRMCDSVIIWRIADTQPWDYSLNWYQTTKEFIDRLA